jgi:hypothetical protein
LQTSNSNSPGISATGADSISEATGKAAEMGRKAADMVNEKRGAAARGLDAAASALHSRAESLPGGEKVASAAHTAADAVGSAAEYVRDTDVKAMMADVQQLIRNNPRAALVTAAVLGFVIARAFSRD